MAAEAQRHNGSTLGERMSMQSHGLNNKANIYMSAWANASMRNFDTCKQLLFVLSCKRCDVHTTQKSELPNSCVHVSETRSSNGLFFAKRHQICPQEQKRTPKELRASRSGKIHAQRPGRAKTVAREREPLPSNGFTGRCASHGCYERAEKPDAPIHCENETERAPKGSHGGKRAPIFTF